MGATVAAKEIPSILPISLGTYIIEPGIINSLLLEKILLKLLFIREASPFGEIIMALLRSAYLVNPPARLIY